MSINDLAKNLQCRYDVVLFGMDVKIVNENCILAERRRDLESEKFGYATQDSNGGFLSKIVMVYMRKNGIDLFLKKVPFLIVNVRSWRILNV